MECFPRFCRLWKRRPTTCFCEFLTFSHKISICFQPNWLYFGLKTQLGWKKTEIMWENVKNLQNHFVGRRFYKWTKRRPTTRFGKFLTFSHIISVFFQPSWLYLGLKTQLTRKKTEFMWENVKNLKNHLSLDIFTTKQKKIISTFLVLSSHLAPV